MMDASRICSKKSFKVNLRNVSKLPASRTSIRRTPGTWVRSSTESFHRPAATNLGRARVSYSFTPSVFVQALVQYNDREDLWASNLRLAWLFRANTGLYVVYNEIRDIGRAGTGVPDRSLTVKFSYMFDLLR